MKLKDLKMMLDKLAANQEIDIKVLLSRTSHCQGADETWDYLAEIDSACREDNTIALKLGKEESV
jgi:hypothetical protein